MGTAAKPTRENRTITIDFHDEATYVQLLDNGKAFKDLADHCAVVFKKSADAPPLRSLGFSVYSIQ
jgi:hypothetical protein